jgi:hypothetical protein
MSFGPGWHYRVRSAGVLRVRSGDSVMSKTVGLPCRRAGRVIRLAVGGGICSLTGFFLKLNWIFLETQLGCIFGLIGGFALPLSF